MTATIVTIGDELLIGQVQDTNAAWLARELAGLGIPVRRVVTVGDETADIGAAIGEALGKSNIVVATGGLGPTHDDVTREAVADYLGVALRLDARAYKGVERFFAERGRAVPPHGDRVAMVPEGFVPLPNSVGTAPGLWLEKEAVLVLVPGVPREMKALFREEIAPRLRRLLPPDAIRHRTLCTAGVGESDLQEMIGDILHLLGPDLKLAYLPRPGQVRLRLAGRGAHAGSRLDRLEARLRARLGGHVFGAEGDVLEAVLGSVLRSRRLRIALAESCSGGLGLNMLTNVPGSSDYVAGGVVAYSNAAKRSLLGVPAAALEAHGAVSRVVALKMAQGVRARFGADAGLGITGIAGPGGGSDEKPVGTTWIAYADAQRETARCYRFGTHREANKIRSAIAALDLARRQILAADQE